MKPIWSRRLGYARFVISKISRVRTLSRVGIVNSLMVPYYKRYEHGMAPLPMSVTIYPTYRCNLNCVMCNQTSSRIGSEDRPIWYDPKQELEVQAWASLFDQIQSFHPILYVLGGEPLLYPQIRELIQEAKKRKLWVHLATNGALLPKFADFLVEQGVEGVAISLDGPPETHDRVRGVEGAFKQAFEGAKALIAARGRYHKNGPFLGMIFTITKHNYEGMQEAMECAVGLNADAFWACHATFKTADMVANQNAAFSESNAKAMGLQMDFPSIRDHSYYQSEMESEDIPKLLETIHRTREAVDGRIEFILEPRLSDDLVAPYYLDMNFPFAPRCDSLWRTFSVQPNGRVSPCLNLVAGNITKESVKDIWNGQAFQKIRRMFTNNIAPGCTRCPGRHYVESSRCLT